MSQLLLGTRKSFKHDELEYLAKPKNLRVVSESIDTSSSYENVENLLRPLLSKYGEIDVLVNCAGSSIDFDFMLILF